jgi:hypothetical protein
VQALCCNRGPRNSIAPGPRSLRVQCVLLINEHTTCAQKAASGPPVVSKIFGCHTAHGAPRYQSKLGSLFKSLLHIMWTALTWSVYTPSLFRHLMANPISNYCTPVAARCPNCTPCLWRNLQATVTTYWMMTSAHRPAEICCCINSRHNQNPEQLTPYPATQFPSPTTFCISWKRSLFTPITMFYKWAMTWSPLEADTSRDIIKFDLIIPTVTKQLAPQRQAISVPSLTSEYSGWVASWMEQQNRQGSDMNSPFSLKAGEVRHSLIQQIPEQLVSLPSNNPTQLDTGFLQFHVAHIRHLKHWECTGHKNVWWYH